MEKEERQKLYEWAKDKWGIDSQLDQATEEMAELIVAINKVKRTKLDLAYKKEQVMDNFFEEIADVKMCIEQLEYLFGENQVEEMLEKKLQKFLGQLKK